MPCGIADAGVTSLTAELGRRISVDDVRGAGRRGRVRRPRRPPRQLASTSVTVAVQRKVRKLLRLEVRNAETPIERKPPWIKTRAKMGPEYNELKALVRREGLHTVCEEAGCPNIYECWEDREATFLIGGEQCTRRCDFCQIDTGKPAELDRDEPRRVAESVAAMGLRYSTVTGVARDDLPDGGAWLYAETVRQIKAAQPEHRRRTADPRLQRRAPNSSSRCSRHAQKCWRTTSKRCRASSSASGRRSATSAASTC